MILFPVIMGPAARFAGSCLAANACYNEQAQLKV